MNAFRIVCVGLCLLIVAWLPQETRADEPSLTELVGTDVGICIEVHGLKEHFSDLPNAEWFRRLTQLPFVKKWQQGPEFSKLQAGRVTLEALVGQPLDQFSVELLGESVLLAIVPTQQGKPTVVLLSRAAREDSWDRVLRLWDQLEAHDVQTMSAFGRSFQRRRKKVDGQKAGPDLFTAKVGRTLAISESEEQIRNVLARTDTTATANGLTNLASLPQYKNAMTALPKSCSIRVLVNPRVWDAEFQRNKPADAWISAGWKKLEWLTAGIELREGVVLHAVVRHDTGGLPDVWQQVLQASQETSDLAARLPANAMLAGVLRLDPKLVNWVRTLDQSERSQRDWQTFAKVSRGLLGRDLFEEVLPHFRPNLGGAIVPTLPLREQAAPVDALLAWEYSIPVTEDGVEGQPTFQESLDASLSALLSFAATSHNGNNPESPAVVRRMLREDMVLRWLEGLSPYRPAFGVLEKHLLVASNPQLISNFPKTSVAISLASEPLFATVRSRHFEDYSQWLFLNASATRRFVVENHEPLSGQLAYWRKIEASSAGQHLDRLAEMLTPFDTAFSATKISAGEVRWTVGLVTPTR